MGCERVGEQQLFSCVLTISTCRNKRALGHLFDRFQEQSDQQTLEFGELRGSANQIRKQLESTYCGTLAVEFMHLNVGVINYVVDRTCV